MRVIALLIWVVLAQAPGQPKQRVSQDASATSTKHPDNTNNNQGNTANDGINRMVEEELRIEQQNAQTSAENEANINQEITIERKLAEYTKGLVFVGIGQAVVLLLTVVVIYKQVVTSRRIERGWVTVIDVDMPHGMQKAKNGWFAHGFGFDWSVKNCGRTPIRIMRIGARFHQCKISELGKQPDIEKSGLLQPTQSYPNGLSIGPNEVIERYTLFEGKPPSTQSDYTEIREGKITCLAYGVVEYKTIFDRRGIRKTHFCYIWTPGMEETFLRSPEPAEYTKQT